MALLGERSAQPGLEKSFNDMWCFPAGTGHDSGAYISISASLPVWSLLQDSAAACALVWRLNYTPNYHEHTSAFVLRIVRRLEEKIVPF